MDKFEALCREIVEMGPPINQDFAYDECVWCQNNISLNGRGHVPGCLWLRIVAAVNVEEV